MNKVNITLRENSKTGDVQMLNCMEAIVETEKDIQKVLTKGQKHRTTASTNMNDVSSRSHAILTLFISQDPVGSGLSTTSKLSLIDLSIRFKEKVINDMEVLKAENETYQKMNEKLENEVSADMSELSKLQTDLNKKENELDAVKTKVNDLQLDLNQKEQDVKKMNVELMNLRDENEFSMSSINLQRSTSSGQAQDTNKALSTSINQLKQHIITLTSQSSRDKKEMKDLTEEKEMSLKALGGFLLRMNRGMEADSINGNDVSNKSLISLISKLAKSYESKESKFNEERETLEARNRYMEITMSRLHEAKTTIDKHLVQFETNTKVSRERINELEQENKELLSKQKQFENIINENESKIQFQKDALERERNDKKEARDAISKVVEKSNERIQEIKDLHHRIQKLEKQLEKAVKQNRKLLNELHEASQLYHQSKRESEEMRNARERHTRRDLELRTAISTQLVSLHNAESNLLAESELAKGSRANVHYNVHG